MKEERQWILASTATALGCCAVLVLLAINVIGCILGKPAQDVAVVRDSDVVAPGLEMLYEGAIEFDDVVSPFFTEEEIACYRLKVRCVVEDGLTGQIVTRFEIQTDIGPVSELGDGVFATLQCPVDIGDYPLGKLYHIKANCVWVNDMMLDINCRPGPDEYVDIGAFVGQGVEFRSVYLPLLTKRR